MSFSVGRLWQYVRLGHGGYLAFGLQCANFVIITYAFFVQKIVQIEPLHFALFFGTVYVPLAAVMGYLQVTKQNKLETRSIFENNPAMAAQFLLIIRMLQDRATPEEVAQRIEYLERIAKK